MELLFKVIETPDVSNLTLEGKAADDEIKKWSDFDPDLILLAIRCKQKTCAENLLWESTPELSQVDFHHIHKDNTSQASIRQLSLFPDEPRHNINVLIVGKTGNGKSTVGNSLLNYSAFCVTRGFASATTRPKTQSARRYGVNITVTDTSDLSNMSVDDKDVDREIHSWRTFQPDVILLTIRCDVRYRPKEFQIYKQIKKGLRDDYLCPRLTVAFTFGERLDRDIKEELKDACIELHEVLKDADNRYLVFRKDDAEEKKRKHIMHLMTFVPTLENEGEIKKILLLGPPKSGKSSGGDAIVGRPVFQAGTETVRTVSYLTYINDTWCQLLKLN
ncbi:hypothetical protein C0Q70_17258 [Pomacea canaliculata]|uniref:AIG1-type G domain-containing protein n=1 Tax=Pomacea canaliculata TaxID=400727 RepID=A0A2T7NS59_POMCA|nr:hypothetical protein C0Q70_17258 [Pomacea canaliculata]